VKVPPMSAARRRREPLTRAGIDCFIVLVTLPSCRLRRGRDHSKLSPNMPAEAGAEAKGSHRPEQIANKLRTIGREKDF
jgi:hypothetical protein